MLPAGVRYPTLKAIANSSSDGIRVLLASYLGIEAGPRIEINYQVEKIPCQPQKTNTG